MVSDDLISVKGNPIHPSSPLAGLYTFAMGSKAFTAGYHTWDVNVGDSLCWIVGVTCPSLNPERQTTFTIRNSSGCFAIQRDNDKYLALNSPNTHILNLPSSRPLQVLRVKLLIPNIKDDNKNVKVSFSDAQRGSHIYSFKLKGDIEELYPFLCPLGRGDKLRLEPVEVKVEVKETRGFWEKYGQDILLYGFLGLLVLICIIILVIAVIFKMCPQCSDEFADTLRRLLGVDLKGS